MSTAANWVGLIFFALAVLHTFAAQWIRKLSHHFSAQSFEAKSLHLFSEVELVFASWAILFLIALGFFDGGSVVSGYVAHLNFTEPLFVSVILCVAATEPILQFARRLMALFSKLIPLPGAHPFVFSALTLGPLLGSFITEPAAMTLTALLLRDRLFRLRVSETIKFLGVGTLFVNVSIGGVLTPFAAPPVVMVAHQWGWGFELMLTLFAWKAVLACAINALIFSVVAYRPLSAVRPSGEEEISSIPGWLLLLHLTVLSLIVVNGHSPGRIVGIFLLFLGLVALTRRVQKPIPFRSALLVGCFLGGLVVLGPVQRWWLQPLIVSMNETALYFAAVALTAVTDNAALTYLGAQVEGLSFNARYYLVAGSVVGGGLSVIANAPNPIGYSILTAAFPRGITVLGLLSGALVPTLVALCFFSVL